jgi:multidrug efflux pump subunit AcrA (membrane-fusion protein)
MIGVLAVGTLAVLLLIYSGSGQDSSRQAITYKVARGDMVLTVTEDGNVESASNVDVKCEIAGGGTILWIVEDGKQVKKGDEIVRLDQSQLVDLFNAQKITYEKARAMKIQAEEDFEAAKIAVEEYAEGMFLKELQTLEAQITIAMENLRSAQNMLKHTEVMSRKGFATTLQLEADQFAVERSNLELDSAKTAKTVLEKYTKAKTIITLEAARDAAEARSRSETAATNLEKVRMDRLEAQLADCVINAPANGMAIWANQQGGRRRQETPAIEEGALVREQQTIIRLPDLTKMQVKVTVHETKVDEIKPGLPATITILDRDLSGKVVAVANQPEAGSWYATDVKEYSTTVSIDGEATGLKPGMTAEVEILIAEMRDVLMVPVQAVVEQRGDFYCWVQTGDGPERRPVVMGATNDTMIEIKDGVSDGDDVILNPRALISEARDQNGRDTEEDEGGEGRGKRNRKTRGKDSGESESNSKRRSESDENKQQTSPADDEKPSDRARQNSGGAESAAGGEGSRRNRGFNLMSADTDKDGKISREEAPAPLQQRFDRIDANGDGFIDAAEIQARRNARNRSSDE